MLRRVSVVLIASAFVSLALACGDSSSTGGGSQSASSTSGGGGNGGDGGNGGMMTGSSTTTTGSSMMSGSTGSSSSSGGGGSNYTTCGDCTSDTGAPDNECKAARDACFSMKECVSLYNCNYFGIPGGPGPCDSTQNGACCSLQCDELALTAEAVTLYRALDQCIYCQTCTSLCGTADTYCPVFKPGGSSVCPP